MSKMFQLYGVGQAIFSVLPPPIAFENPPTSNQTNFEIGQIVYSPPKNPNAFFMYGGNGDWIELASSTGPVLAVNGTASEITATNVAGTVTLSLPIAVVAPGSLSSTTTLTGGTGVTATTGNITATNGNLVLNSTGNKLVIHASTPASDSIGTSAALDGASPSQLVVSTTAVTASSKIFLSYATAGGTQGSLSYGTIVPGTSFQIKSSANGDTSTVNYLIIN